MWSARSSPSGASAGWQGGLRSGVVTSQQPTSDPHTFMPVNVMPEAAKQMEGIVDTVADRLFWAVPYVAR